MQIKLDLFAANKLLSEEIKDDTDKVNSIRSSIILISKTNYLLHTDYKIADNYSGIEKDT